MNIEIQKKETGLLQVLFTGDLDYHVSSELREKLSKVLEDKPSRVLLDFASVGYMDSSGIAAFVEFSQKAKASGTRMVFLNLTEPVRQVFTLAKLHLFFRLADSEAEALKFLS